MDAGTEVASRVQIHPLAINLGHFDINIFISFDF